MTCPRCKTVALAELDRDGVTIDRCGTCRGIWLDRGELEKLIVHGRAAEREATARRLEGDDDGPRSAHLEDDDRDRGDDKDDDDDGRHRDRGRRRSWWELFD